VVLATREHAEALARTMRAEDVAECHAGGLAPLAALVQSVDTSDVAYAALVDGQVGAMFGVGQLAGVDEPVGHVWFLTGASFARHPRPFVRIARWVVAHMLQLYPVLFNIIDFRYTAAVRWAKWLGFDVGEPMPFGPAGVPFVSARLRRDAWAR
jgi:hypothetical protein